MTFLLVWILASFGLAYVCGHAYITRSLREWAFQVTGLRWFVMLVECPSCLGYWIGTLTGPWAFRHAGIPLPWWAAVVIGSFVICGSNYVLARWTQLIPAMEWMQPTANSAKGLHEATPDELKSGLGICDARQSPLHHGSHWHLESCVNWRQIQQVHTQEAQR